MANTKKNSGEVINSRWKITETLSSNSGQAHTYKVRDLQNESDEKEYVIKLLKKINDKTLARFKNEIKASLTLEHPNIVRAVDSKYEDASEPYLVMDYCSGGELNKKKIENLSLKKKLEMFESVCEGIAHAHENKVIHRDIKPRNIFLTDQKNKTPLIGDFGICFFEEDENNEERLTAIRETVGAKSFRPPESEFGIVENVNPSFDVYSLGKLLYWFLSNGDVPIREHYSHEKFDLRNGNSEQAIYFAYEIFDKSIREETTERYTNATEMLEDLRKLMTFIENDARYLDCNIPQNCIFCRIGTYELRKSPKITDRQVLYNYSEYLGYKTPEYNSMGTGNIPTILVARCKNCGNVQQFRLDKEFNTAANWKNIPEAD
ncbi:MAG: serine/threonine-protein kinase [Pyrinomonadaceae bacterium]